MTGMTVQKKCPTCIGFFRLIIRLAKNKTKCDQILEIELWIFD